MTWLPRSSTIGTTSSSRKFIASYGLCHGVCGNSLLPTMDTPDTEKWEPERDCPRFAMTVFDRHLTFSVPSPLFLHFVYFEWIVYMQNWFVCIGAKICKISAKNWVLVLFCVCLCVSIARQYTMDTHTHTHTHTQHNLFSEIHSIAFSHCYVYQVKYADRTRMT